MTSRTQYYAATSLDGFLADDDHGIDWLMQFGFEEFQERYDAFMANVGAIVMGARTYDFVIAQNEPWGYATTPTFVVTHGSYAAPDDADVRYVSGDVREVHAAASAAAGDRNVWMMGGGDLAAQFTEHDLIDELVITLMPVLLGSGKPLHPGVAVTTPFRLTNTHAYASGAIELAYALDHDAS